ncbi:MAG: hypothetical protein R2991_14665 [Thermoanaerobaculia bacterium]
MRRSILFLGLFQSNGQRFAENVVAALTGAVPVELQTFDIE